MIENVKDILQKACLIQLKTGTWIGTKKLPVEVLMRIGSPEWYSGTKHLVDSDILAPPRQIVSRARKFLASSALPFPLTGLTLVNKDSIEKIEDWMQGFKDEFKKAVGDVDYYYLGAKEAARIALQADGLYDEADYPTNIRQKYSFEWSYLTLDVPGKHTILSPEVYAREMKKFEDMMEEARDVAVDTLRMEFQELVDHMIERLTPGEDGKVKRFKESTVQNFRNFFQSFNERNLFEDEKLAEIVREARATLKYVTASNLRDNVEVRRSIRTSMEVVKTMVDEAIETRPSRRIIFDPEQKVA